MAYFKHHHIERSLVLTITYLILLFLLKIKILWGYQFLWARSFLVTKQIIPESIGYLNPFFYFDDIFVAFICFTICLYLFSKKDKKINILVYIFYLLICIYSILASIIFYKYGVPLTSEIVYQIDSLYTMKTSIDIELHENLRLILGSIALLIFSVAFPIFLNYIYTFITKYRNNIKITKITPSRPILILILFFVAFSLKTYYFGSKILTESPLTTLSKSVAINLSTRIFLGEKNIPEFDDRIVHSSTNFSQNNQDTVITHRRKHNVILLILETTSTQFFNPASQFAKYLPNLTKLSEEGLYLSNCFTPFPRSSKAFFQF